MNKTTNYTEAQNRLAQARREMRANELRIKAYEHKLKKDIDPDSPDWDKTLANNRPNPFLHCISVVYEIMRTLLSHMHYYNISISRLTSTFCAEHKTCENRHLGLLPMLSYMCPVVKTEI